MFLWEARGVGREVKAGLLSGRWHLGAEGPFRCTLFRTFCNLPQTNSPCLPHLPPPQDYKRGKDLVIVEGTTVGAGGQGTGWPDG